MPSLSIEKEYTTKGSVEVPREVNPKKNRELTTENRVENI